MFYRAGSFDPFLPPQFWSLAKADFALEFADLGAGAVDTSAARGGAAATFTRAAATATTVGPTGLVLKAIGANVARSYYDPTTLAYLGYLAEGARTNLGLQSENLGTTWGNVNSTESLNATTSPDGTVNADKLEEDNANGSHTIFQNITVTNNAICTSSFFVKASERSWVSITEGNAVTATIWFDVANGVVGTVAGTGSPSGTIKAYPNGWFRCTMTFTASGTTPNLQLRLATGDNVSSYQGVTGSGAYVWGGQLEEAAFASSYIPTTTTSVTRNADVLTYPTTGWLSATAGTMLAQFAGLGDSGTTQNIFAFDDGTSNEQIELGLFGVAVPYFFGRDGGVTQWNIDAGAWTVGTLSKLIGAYAASSQATSINGGTPVTNASGTLPTVTTARVGCRVADTSQLFGPIRRVAYWAERLPDAILQNLTR